MPRIARIKSTTSIYHIMSKSISEIKLFKNDDDKKNYLYILKDYQKIYSFKVYAYCLMDNHLHMIIDSNGADISKIMHSINLKYASYFNRKYQRHGHLFQDRFKSKVVNNDRYLLTLTAYIHNNPSDLPGFEKHIEKYHFSSLGVYLGLRKDDLRLLDYKFVLSMIGHKIKTNESRHLYKNFVSQSKCLIEEKDAEFENEATEYRSERKILTRDFKIIDIIEFVSKIMNINKLSIHIKNDRRLVNSRALLVFMLRNLCNSSCKDICNVIGNITQSRISKLCKLGKDLIDSEDKYNNVIFDFIVNCA